MKIFAFSGLNRTEGLTNEIIDKFINNLKIDNKNVFRRSSVNSKIKFVSGPEMFITGKDSIHDDMNKIRQEIQDSDIVIIGTPVYVSQISGSTKVFIDRLAAWTHTFKLSGKLAIIFAVSSSTGEDISCQYLSYVIQHMGASVDSELLINTSYQDINNIFEQVDFASEKILRHIRSKDYTITKMQEQSFKISQEKLKEGELFPYELQQLSSENISSFNSYKDYFLKHIKI